MTVSPSARDSTPVRPRWCDEYDPGVADSLVTGGQTGLTLFDASRALHPETPAIHFWDTTISWADVDRASRGFAAWLVGQGAGSGDRVGIWLQNVPEFIVAMIGTWRAGCVVVPLNPMLRQKEIFHQLTDSGTSVLVAEASLIADVGITALREQTAVHAVVTVDSSHLSSGDSTAAALGTAWATAAGTGTARLDLDPLAPGPDDPAFLVYTSGTTGVPKAAVNTHANVAYNAHVFRSWMHLGPGDVILGGAPLFHVTGLIGGICASHAAGVPLVLFYRFRPEPCLSMIERWRTTFTVLPSTAIRALLDSPELATCDISSLTKLYSGGAPIPTSLAVEWQAVTGLPLHSIYGLTETTSPTHAAPLGRAVPIDEESGLLSVGLPVPGVDVRVVDPDGNEVRQGELGEIWMKGPMVVPGYWHKPDETAAAFVDGYLRSGDVGTRDAAGWFYVVDRIKDMINASGFKVWPREVEEMLLSHPAIAEAAVVGVPDAYRGETVKAFVRLRAGEHTTPDEIIAWARIRMAAYKYPRIVEVVTALPKTSTGKVLRRELRTPSWHP